MKVQLVYFTECPNVDAARAALRDALTAERLDVTIEEIDVERDDAPSWARGWGSPTILIDGADIAGQSPSSSASCRLYPTGGPSVRLIRDGLVAARAAEPNGSTIAAPMIGAVAAALAASACCIIPMALAVVGVSGAGIGSVFAPYRVFFLLGTVLALGVGFWMAYRRTKDECGCAVPRRRRVARVMLWITTVLAVGLAIYPLLLNGDARVGETDAPAAATLRLKITGMDCPECTETIAKRVKQVPGVVSVSIDYKTGIAVVRHDDRASVSNASIAAVKAAGFRAEVAP